MDNDLIKTIPELNEEKTIELVQYSLDKGLEPFQILRYLQEGMKKVIELYKAGNYFIVELVMAGEIFNKVLKLEAMQTLMSSRHEHYVGTILLGTMENDVHNIGKDIFKAMAIGKDFNVIDLGCGIKKEIFLQETKNIQPDIVGISGFRTSAAIPIAELIELFKKEGIRDQIKVIIGGNPEFNEACKFVGADDIVHDAELGVQKCYSWMKEKA